MSDSKQLTAEEFATTKDDLPDGGRWVELVAGRVVTLQPPDETHGNVVLNFSKALAAHFESVGAAKVGSACFDLGLQVARDPDTVRVPHLSYFSGGERFGQADRVVTETPPVLVVEIASTNDRRRHMATRVRDYFEWGVKCVWLIDSAQCQCSVHSIGRPSKQLLGPEFLSGDPFLPGFRVRVADLFAEPQWWRG